jgi:hypothetical protein
MAKLFLKVPNTIPTNKIHTALKTKKTISLTKEFSREQQGKLEKSRLIFPQC